MPQEHVFTTLGLNQVQVWHILQQACGRMSNTIQKCHSFTFKAEENQDKFEGFLLFSKMLKKGFHKFDWE